MIIAYISLGVSIALFVGFVSAMLVATILDWNYRRKNRVLLALKRDYSQPRRPAAK